MTQVVKKVWYQMLFNKFMQISPRQYCKILGLHITGRMLRVKQKQDYSTVRNVKVLYLLYTHDLPQEDNITIAKFMEDTTILELGGNSSETSEKIQQICKKWRTKINESKLNINFAYE